MMRLVAAALGTILIALASSIAGAQFFNPALFFPKAVVAFTGPGDVVSGATAFYGMEAYNAAYATGSNSAFDYSCTGGSPATGTIKILSTGYADAATLSTACGGNTITATKIYDQVGTRNLDTCGAGGGCLQVKLSCQGTHPCFHGTAGGLCNVSSSSTANIATPYTMIESVAAEATPSGNQRTFDAQTQGSVGINGTPAAFVYAGGSVVASGTVTLSTFYLVMGVVGASTGSVSLNGTTTSGSPGTGNFQGIIGMVDNAGGCVTTAIDVLDAGVWPSDLTSNISAMTSQERANFGY